MKKIGFLKYIVLLVMGLILFLCSLIFNLDSIWAGFGGGLMGVSLMYLYRCYKYSKDKEYADKMNITVHDERNIQISIKAGNVAFRLFLVLLVLLELGLLLLGYRDMGIACGFLICFGCILYVVLYKVYQNKL